MCSMPVVCLSVEAIVWFFIYRSGNNTGAARNGAGGFRSAAGGIFRCGNTTLIGAV